MARRRGLNRPKGRCGRENEGLLLTLVPRFVFGLVVGLCAEDGIDAELELLPRRQEVLRLVGLRAELGLQRQLIVVVIRGVPLHLVATVTCARQQR